MVDVLVSFDFPPMIGGAHTWLYELYSRWPTEVRVLTSEYSFDLEEASREKKFDQSAPDRLKISRRVRTPPLADALSTGYLARLWSQIKLVRELAALEKFSRKQRATIHVLRAIPEGVPAWLYCAARPRSTRLVTYVHGEDVLIAQASRQLSALARRIYEASHLIIANSRNTQKLLVDAFPRVSSVCIHPGVDINEYQVGSNRGIDYRSMFSWPKETVIVFTLARMERRKNHAMLIRALAQLRNERVPVALICGGDGPERGELEKLVDMLGVVKWVKFLGAIPEDEKPMIFASSDIFAMPSISVGEMIEGFGIVLLEAAASGLPTICGSTGGQPEAIRDGRTGFCVDGNSIVAVMTALKTLANDEKLRHKFGAEGRLYAEEHDWKRLAKNVFNEVSGCWS